MKLIFALSLALALSACSLAPFKEKPWSNPDSDKTSQVAR